MKTNKLTPLEELRREKEIVRKECAESEARLSEHFSYFYDNAGSLIFQGAVNVILRQFGFGPREKTRDKESGDEAHHSGLWATITAYYPVIWEIVQPMLFRFIIRKIKSIFSGKKKRKRRDCDEDDD